MKNFLTVFLIVAGVCSLAAAQDKKLQRKTFVPDEILVKYSSTGDTRLPRVANRAMGANKVEDLGDTGWQRVKIPRGMSVAEAVESYRSMVGVEAAQPNYYYHLLATANDELFGSLYGLTKISAPSAWDLSTGSPSVVVAVIDSGLRYTHQDLAPNAWVNSGEIAGNGVDDDGNGFIDDVRGWDFFFNDSDPFDDVGAATNGHGTHCAGIIGAVGNNMIGVVGVNWNVKILPLKIYSFNGGDSTSAMLVNAYNYVTMMKKRGVNIRVTSNSYGDCGEACGFDQATKDALDAMGDAGVLNVFAAGNAGGNMDNTPFFPASYDSPSILSVAASDQNDARAGFSNIGVVGVDLAAPGSGILSTMNSSDTATGIKSGTSMAAPHAAGAAALLAAFNPALSAASLKATLMNNVDVLANWNGLVKTGGRLNVDNALRNQTVCSFNAGTSQVNVYPRGGIVTLNVTAASNCDYAAKTDTKWMTVLDPLPLSGNGTVRIRVGLSRVASRTGILKIGDTLITVKQAKG